MGNVLEYLIDGTSGLAPGGVDGKAIVAGVCSKGRVGKGYLVGKHSDLAAMLGTGPLVDRLQDVLATGGAEPVVVAVPVQGQPGGYITPPVLTGGTQAASISGIAAKNADIIVRVIKSGPLADGEGEEAAASVEISLDNGKTFSTAQAAAEQIPIGTGEAATGATLCFPRDAVLEAEAVYSFRVRCAVGPVARIGDTASPLLQIVPCSGGVRSGAELVIQIVKGGACNVGTYQLSTDGGDTFGKARTIPVDGVAPLADFGASVSFPAGTYTAGTTYTCRILPPTPSIVDIMAALESPLSLYDVEFVHVAGATDSVDWSAAQAKAEALWDLHRPTYFKMETRLPYDEEDLSDFTAYLMAERQDFAGRFVTVCCQFGEVMDTNGERRLRNMAGLQAGRVMSVPVQRATGRVKDGPIAQATLPEGWEAVQPVLEEAGYLTAKKYAGLSGVYWGDSRTAAEDTSDYRYEEVLRVTFKAVRLLRIAALKSLYDEAGDPLRPEENGGLAYLKAQLENALDTMVKALPRELAGYVVDIPKGQDIANNGVAVVATLIGIPIIRNIKLFAKYVYSGGAFDPRLQDYAITA